MKKIIAMFICAALVLSFSAAVICSAAQTEPYLIGDADGSGEVDAVDSVRVQRVLILIDTDADGSISERGDVNNDGLDAVDATLIQRFATKINTPFPIGEWFYPQQPTEESTQAPTQKPTRDEYELPFVPAK